MNIVKSFSYDPEDSPKCHEWVKKQDNFSLSVRRLIESDVQKQDNIAQILKDIAVLREEIRRLELRGLAPVEQAQVLEIGQITEAIAEQPEIKVNIAALKNRYGD